MRIQELPPLHLTYCLNIHKGETWAEHFAAIRDLATAVRNRVAPDLNFGLGLRIGAPAAQELHDPHRIGDFKAFLAEQGLYVFTINGFPYGNFHGGPVKENVYLPDWRDALRRDYTIQLGDILAELLPRDSSGSISTVPLAFKGRLQTDADLLLAISRLVEVAVHLELLSRRRRCDLHIGLEPEPGCHLETTVETLAFFRLLMLRGAPEMASQLGLSRSVAEDILRRRIGVCLDTCHVALQYENLAETWDAFANAGVRISKVQISAALSTGPETLEALAPFDETTYLHQTLARAADGSIRRWNDLGPALRDLRTQSDWTEARCHFHVPLFWDGGEELRSTRDAIDPAFVRRLREGGCDHLEIETYTFDVLPKAIRPAGVVDSIAREYAWTLDRLGRRA